MLICGVFLPRQQQWLKVCDRPLNILGRVGRPQCVDKLVQEARQPLLIERAGFRLLSQRVQVDFGNSLCVPKREHRGARFRRRAHLSVRRGHSAPISVAEDGWEA